MYLAKMVKMDIYLSLIYIFFKHIALSRPDPCYTYSDLNDTTMTLAFSLGPTDTPICDVITPNIWYRFVSSTEGIMATDCPSGSECGTNQQVWMQGTIPSYYNGTTYVDICILGNGDCCDRQSRIQVKNCNSFLVYNLITIPPCTRYCFNESSDMLVTVSTTSTTTTVSTLSTTQSTSNSSKDTEHNEEQNGLNNGEMAGIIVGVISAVALVSGIAVYLKFRSHGNVVVSDVAILAGKGTNENDG